MDEKKILLVNLAKGKSEKILLHFWVRSL